jgi:hypothetical protein
VVALQFGLDLGHRGGDAGADHLFYFFGKLRELCVTGGWGRGGGAQRGDIDLVAQARRTRCIRRFDQPRRRRPAAFVTPGHVSG